MGGVMFIDDDEDEGFFLESSFIVWQNKLVGTMFLTEEEAVNEWKKLNSEVSEDDIPDTGEIDYPMIQELTQTQTNVFFFESSTATIQ